MSVRPAVTPRVSHRPSKAWWGATAALASLTTAGAWVLWHQTPGQSAWLPPCLFHSLTGLYCTGCGITRAAHALVHGDLAGAWSMTALAVLGIPPALFLWAFYGLGKPSFLERVALLLQDARTWAVLVLGFTVLRNLPWAPFTALAPG